MHSMVTCAIPRLMKDISERAFPLYRAGNKAEAADAFLRVAAGLGNDYRSIMDKALPGAWAKAVNDIDTLFRVELPALESWRFARADAGRIPQPILSVRSSSER